MVGQTGLYRGHCSYFLECVYFGLLYPSLIFDMFIVVCVFVGVGVGVILSFTNSFFVCVSVYHGEFCGFKFTGSFFFLLFLYMYTYVCV